MWKKLKKLAALNKAGLYLCLGVQAGVFLLCQIIIAIVMAAAKPEEGVRVSGLVLASTGTFLLLGVALSNVLVTYVQAVQFGSTRRRGLLLAAGLTGAEYLLTVALTVACTLLEKCVCPAFWRALAGRSMELTFYLDGLDVPWWVFLAAPLAGAAAGLVLAAVLLRFGQRGGWAIWGIVMLGTAGQSLLPWDVHGFYFPWLFPVLGAVSAGAVSWSVWYLLRAPVKG